MNIAGQFSVFFVVAIFGLTIDVGFAWLLSDGFGIPLWLGAASGFLLATYVNFHLNRIWTFGSRGGSRRQASFLIYLLCISVVLGVRLMAVYTLTRLIPPELQATPIILSLAAGLSFVANFLLVRRYVYRP